MRLIDADALGIGKANREVFEKPEYADGWNSAIDIIENAPTVDAVEVVRCKDCKFWDEETKEKHSRSSEDDTLVDFAECNRFSNYATAQYLRHDDFCSLGERKGEGVELKEFRCANGLIYHFSKNHCVFCEHCTNLFWDYTNGPYMFLCELECDGYKTCGKFEEENRKGGE